MQFKRQLAALFQKAPWLVVLAQRLWLIRQARYFVGAVGVVFDDAGRILLLEHVFHPKRPWGLPGGWVDRRESPGEAVARELREETGLRVRVTRPLLVELGESPGRLELAYLCQFEGGEVRLCDEILSYRWIQPEDLPDMISFHRRAIECALAARETA